MKVVVFQWPWGRRRPAVAHAEPARTAAPSRWWPRSRRRTPAARASAPAAARARRAGRRRRPPGPARRRARSFFSRQPAGLEEALIADGLTWMASAAKRACNSASVLSGATASSAWTGSAWAASLARRPPRTGAGASVPARRQRCTSLITQLGLTPEAGRGGAPRGTGLDRTPHPFPQIHRVRSRHSSLASSFQQPV